MRRRRPVLGTISGIVFGVFLALSLALWGVVPLDSVVLTIVLLGGIVLGVAVGFTAPLARLRGTGGAPEAPAPAVAGEAPAPHEPPPPPHEPPPPPAEPDAVSGQAAAEEETSGEGTEDRED